MLLRRRYLKLLSEHTGRAAIFYGTCWLENKQVQERMVLELPPRVYRVRAQRACGAIGWGPATTPSS